MVLKFNRPHHLCKLHDEILAAVPALRPVPGSDGVPVARLLIGGDGQTVEMVVPDDLAPEDLAAIEAVVNVHDPTPPPPPPDPDEELMQALEVANAQVQASTDFVTLRAAVMKLVSALQGKVRPGRAKGRPV
ncbi:MAG TPA: hypothetical protein VIK75_04275 [Calditerricola sp.]